MNKKIGHSMQEPRMLKENLHGARAVYGKQILVTVSRELTAKYGHGFSYPERTRMVQFPQLFPEESIVVTLSQQLITLQEITADIFAIEQEAAGLLDGRLKGGAK